MGLNSRHRLSCLGLSLTLLTVLSSEFCSRFSSRRLVVDQLLCYSFLEEEARVALGYASGNSYASFVLSKLPVCFISR